MRFPWRSSTSCRGWICEAAWSASIALHTQDETARTTVLEGGGDYVLTCKDNQPTLRANIETKVTAPRADFPPRDRYIDGGSNVRDQQGAEREPGHLHR